MFVQMDPGEIRNKFSNPDEDDIRGWLRGPAKPADVDAECAVTEKPYHICSFLRSYYKSAVFIWQHAQRWCVEPYYCAFRGLPALCLTIEGDTKRTGSYGEVETLHISERRFFEQKAFMGFDGDHLNLLTIVRVFTTDVRGCVVLMRAFIQPEFFISHVVNLSREAKSQATRGLALSWIRNCKSMITVSSNYRIPATWKYIMDKEQHKTYLLLKSLPNLYKDMKTLLIEEIEGYVIQRIHFLLDNYDPKHKRTMADVYDSAIKGELGTELDPAFVTQGVQHSSRDVAASVLDLLQNEESQAYDEQEGEAALDPEQRDPADRERSPLSRKEAVTSGADQAAAEGSGEATGGDTGGSGDWSEGCSACAEPGPVRQPSEQSSARSGPDDADNRDGRPGDSSSDATTDGGAIAGTQQS